VQRRLISQDRADAVQMKTGPKARFIDVLAEAVSAYCALFARVSWIFIEKVPEKVPEI
jgi:hypothetical protein